MEKHTCKLCFKRFSNGRALGGHMRSHAMENTSRRPLIKESSTSPPISSSSSGQLDVDQLVFQAGMDRNPSPMIAGVGGGGGGGVGGLGGFYVLRENRKRSFKFTDPEFSAIYEYTSVFQLAGVKGTSSGTHNRNNSSSVVVQDRESETESSMPTSTSSSSDLHRQREEMIEPVSSVSDTTPDEDGALSLMKLSRDFWPTNNLTDSPTEQEEEDLAVSSSEEKEEGRRTRIRKITGGNDGKRSRYYCATCKRNFRSYQALGGHRASHKKIPSRNESGGDNSHRHNDHHRRSQKVLRLKEGTEENEVKLHICPYCFRVFNSGQALGGHKRSHLVAGHSLPLPPPSPPQPSPVAAKIKIESSLIDLNLPALPSEEEEEEEADSSAVSNSSSIPIFKLK